MTKKPLNTAIACALAAGTGTVAAQDTTPRRIEEVTVTATKRAESMQDIAVSINAMTGESIDELGVDNFDEYVQYLPNVVWTGRGPGQAELYIRGASTEQSSITITSVQAAAPAVALYQDEQPVTFAGRNLDIYATDLERIEVLPGPQGTLFGSSSQTGTVRLITNKPQHDAFDAGFEARYSTTKGGEPSTAIEAFMNMPFTDSVAFRVAAFADKAGGWIDNVPGTYAGDIEVINRNQISPFAHLCTGKPEVDDPIGGNCNGVRATMAVTDNSTLVEDDFNEATYSGARAGLSWLINDDWDLLVQHTSQTLETEGVFEYDPNLSGTESVNRFRPTTNQDEFGLTTWTLKGRLAELEVMYTGGFLDRDVFYTQDYTGYTNGGGYQAYYICTGGYSNYTECFDPTKQYLGNSTNERITHEIRFNTDPTNRWRVTAGVYFDDQESTSDGQFQYFGAVEAGYNQASAPGTITDPPNQPPTPGNIVSTVPGVTNPFGRGPATTFVNNFTREEDQLAFFGELEFDITDRLTASIGARNYDLDYQFTGSTGSSFGCKFAGEPCDGQAFDNRVTHRLRALGAFNQSGDVNDLLTFFSPSNAQLIQDGLAAGTFTLEGLGADGVINQDDTIYRATLSWTASDNLMFFGAYSEGYRPQTSNRNAGTPSGNQTGVYEGFMVPAVTKTDELTNYEIGMKGDFIDGRLRLNATAYSSEIDELQMSRFDPANVAFLVFIENIGDADVNGLDADFSWLATDQLTISGAFSFVDNELTRVNPQLNEIVVPVGSRLPFTPEFSGNIRARYDFRLPDFGADAYVRAGVTYTGDSRALSTCNAYFIEDVATQVFGNRTSLKIVEEGGFCGTALTGDDLNSVVDSSFVAMDDNGDMRFKAARYEQESYTVVNLATGFRKDQWGLEFFVNNAFDENAQLNINAADWVPSVTTNRPRTYGIRFMYDY
ncbi:MAG TPA: TonB-dependent receptor [Xanthomonadales bacterium]|nr:TonB-dependent receptor [Xanthomonadales bacterium]